ncbi:peptidase M4 [Opitutaceae bacterium EW11]|nr:peptidase M4 [Opitutaceae bacterium EW11]
MSEDILISTPEATAAEAQSRRGETPPNRNGHRAQVPPVGIEGVHFTISENLGRAVEGKPYERRSRDPVYRPLRIFAVDPSLSRLEGAEAVVNVPYEPLRPGPVGRVLEVDDRDDSRRTHWGRVDLDHPLVLMTSGKPPSVADPESHQQMVYAVASSVYATFRRALGRHLSWGFDRAQGGADGTRLVLRPHAFEAENACYDRERGEICFGYCRAGSNAGPRVLPHGVVFTCLSHDVIVHEMTHALLDGLRAHFALPTGHDVLAFHEGFADLVALFQHFSYPEVLRAAIRKSRGELEHAAFLTDIAVEFGRAVAGGNALRSAVEEFRNPNSPPKLYPGRESHESGEILVRAVFEAFLTVYTRKTERYRRLASHGTGRLPPGELPPDLQEILADRASKLASQFLSICIRAIDYCPPIDLELGEYLRALITADHELVPDDPWGFREALIDAFARRGIYPPAVATLAEDSLRWQPAEPSVPAVPELHFDKLEFSGDPAEPAGLGELRRQARALGALLGDDSILREFGLASPSEALPNGDRVGLPCIQSIRTCRRIGPDGQIVFDLVAEITQSRRVERGGVRFDFFGGATAIVGPRGEIRYLISKNILNEARLERQREYIAGPGKDFWMRDGEAAAARKNLFALLCSGKSPSSG